MQDQKQNIVIPIIIGLIVCIVTGSLIYFLNSEPKIEDDNLQIDTSNINNPNTLDNNTATSIATTTQATTTNTNSTTTKTMQDQKYKIVTLKTSKGDITIELLNDSAPATTANFAKLVASKFYDGVKFHRVIDGFMIQTGDPLSKDESKRAYWGTGGPGYQFADELTGKETYKRGTVAMANSGANTNGSQFFIVTAEDSQLPPKYTVFGKVTSGLDVALAIQKVATNPQNDQPVTDVTINSATGK
jgi:peptidylprolyl isomerase